MKKFAAGLFALILLGCDAAEPTKPPARTAPPSVAAKPATPAEQQKGLDTVFGNLRSSKVVRPSAPEKKP